MVQALPCPAQLSFPGGWTEASGQGGERPGLDTLGTRAWWVWAGGQPGTSFSHLYIHPSSPFQVSALPDPAEWQHLLGLLG